MKRPERLRVLFVKIERKKGQLKIMYHIKTQYYKGCMREQV